MPQRSYHYAVGRVKALEARMLDAVKLRRLAAAGMDEFLKALQEAGYGGGDLPGGDLEELSQKELRVTRQLLGAITPAPAVTGLFLLPVDARNLKVLFKARLQDIDPAELLEEGGMFPPALLHKAVWEKNYGDLPKPLKVRLEDLEKQLARSVSPQMLSVRVDGAIFAYIESVLTDNDSVYARGYFSLLADFTNLRSFLRARAMRWEPEEFSSLFIACGSVPSYVFLHAFVLPDEQLAPALSRGVNAGLLSEAVSEYFNKNSASLLETKIEEHLRRFVARRRNDLTDIGPIVGYLLDKEAEAKALGLVFAALNRGVEVDLPEF